MAKHHNAPTSVLTSCCLLLLLTFHSPLVLSSEEDEDKLSEVEELLKEYEERLDLGVDLSGYVDVEYRGSDKSGANNGFRMHHLSLFFSKNFNEKLRFFSEIEFEDTPKFDATNDGSGDIKEAEGKIFVEALNFDYRFKQWASIRVGRFFTPAGIWSEDHYPPFVSTQERPLHIRKIFPQLVDGMSMFGTRAVGKKSFLQYVAYVGNGESKTSGKKDDNGNKANGFRLNLIYPFADEFMVGVSAYNDTEDTAHGGADKSSWGVHAKLRASDFTFQTELAKADYQYDDNITVDDERDGFYFQTSYKMNKWTLGHRYDQYNASKHDSDELTRNTLFVNYHFNASVSLKFEQHFDSHDSPTIEDGNSFIFTIAAYLGN